MNNREVCQQDDGEKTIAAQRMDICCRSTLIRTLIFVLW